MFSQPIKIRFGLIVAGAVLMASSPSTAAAAAKPMAAPRTGGAVHTSTPANAILRREVFGFVNASNLGDPNVGYPTWNFSLLSTVAFFAIHVQYNGTLITNDSSYTIWNSSTLASLVSTAHASGVKVVVTLRNPSNPADLCDALYNDQTTISQTIAEIQKKGVDGVNIDYEGQYGQCTNNDPTLDTTNQALITKFAKDMRAGLDAAKPGYYLSIDTYSGSASVNTGFFNIPDLAPYVDSFFVMAYDMDWANYGSAPLNCPSYCFSPVSPLNTYQYNVTTSMQQYTAVVPSTKVILGQPYYGSRGCVGSSGPAHQLLVSNYVNTTYIYASTIGSQTGVSNLTRHRDPQDGVSEWDTWWDSDWNCWREQYYDDVVSLGYKYGVVNQMNLRGVGLFTLDYGGGSPELWTLIDNSFATPTPWLPVGGNVTSSPEPAAWGTSRTDVFVRGTEGGLWDATWDGNTWNWTFLGGLIQGNPGAVSWGTNRLDVFARGVDNALWHRSFDGTTWAPWEKLGGYITAGPDAASWGVNRLDVFVRGGEGGLWQVTWNGTGPWNWHYVGGRIFSDPGAVSSTTNRIDVFVKGSEGGLWQASWNGSAWSWNFLGGQLTSDPEPASCAAGHLDVFMTGTEHGLWQRGFNGTSWGPWQYLRGQWTSGPGAVCTPGTTNDNVFERGPDMQVWQTSTPAS